MLNFSLLTNWGFSSSLKSQKGSDPSAKSCSPTSFRVSPKHPRSRTSSIGMPRPLEAFGSTTACLRLCVQVFLLSIFSWTWNLGFSFLHRLEFCCCRLFGRRQLLKHCSTLADTLSSLRCVICSFGAQQISVCVRFFALPSARSIWSLAFANKEHLEYGDKSQFHPQPTPSDSLVRFLDVMCCRCCSSISVSFPGIFR